MARGRPATRSVSGWQSPRTSCSIRPPRRPGVPPGRILELLGFWSDAKPEALEIKG